MLCELEPTVARHFAYAALAFQKTGETEKAKVVGEEAVQRSRQMQWIRIERFIGDGTPDLQTGRPPRRDRESLGTTDVRHSPMMCQQCGAAPCEPMP